MKKTECNNEILLSDFADETLINRICSNNESLDIVELGFKKAYECVYGSSENFSVYFDFLEDDGISLGFFEEKTVVEDVYVEREEIELSEAQKIKLSAKLGENLLIPFNKELFTKESVLIALDYIYKKLNIQHERQIRKSEDSLINNTTNNTTLNSARGGSGWKSYYDEYKSYHRSASKASTEEEVDALYEDGYFDAGPAPFPFDTSDNEDDYGDDSWA